MIQLTIFIIIYLIIFSLILLSDSYGAKNYLLFSISSYYKKHRFFQIIMKISPFFLCVLSFLYPVEPGPIVLGDLFVSVLLLIAPFLLFAKTFMEKKNNISFEFIKRMKVWGYIYLIITIIHIIMPQVVLL